MKIISCVMAAFLLVMSLPGFAKAEKETAVVALPAIAQLIHKTDDARWAGPLVDVLDEVEKRTDIHFELHVRSLKRAVEMTTSGQSDFGVFMRSPARDEVALPLLKIAETSFVVISRNDKPIQKLIELEGKTLGRIIGGVPITPIRAIDGIHYYDFRTHDDGVTLLKAGKIDALLTADFRVLESVKRGHLTLDEITWPLPVIIKEIWLYGSRKSQVADYVIEAFMEDMKVAISEMDRTSLYRVYQEHRK